VRQMGSGNSTHTQSFPARRSPFANVGTLPRKRPPPPQGLSYVSPTLFAHFDIRERVRARHEPLRLRSLLLVYIGGLVPIQLYMPHGTGLPYVGARVGPALPLPLARQRTRERESTRAPALSLCTLARANVRRARRARRGNFSGPGLSVSRAGQRESTRGGARGARATRSLSLFS
jgi:hypothetical protein